MSTLTRPMRVTGTVANAALQSELDRTKAENTRLRGVIAAQNDQIRALRAQIARSIQNERMRIAKRERARLHAADAGGNPKPHQSDLTTSPLVTTE